MRTIHAVLLATVVVLAGCGAGLGGESPTQTATQTAAPDTTAADSTPTPTPGTGPATEQATETPAAQEPADPDEDVLGWENGIWYNESIDVTVDDGLNERELNLTIARTMARVEKIRGLEFNKTVPVSIITRDEFINESSGHEWTAKERLHQNVKWEATLMINESTDAVDVLQSNRGASVLGYYDTRADEIVVISPSGTDGAPEGLDEFTLSHELAHALQDQHFNVSNFFGNTTETDNALGGLVEGDAHYTEYLYEQRCKDGAWECLDAPDSGGGSAGDIHVGVFITQFVRYSEGQEFVKHLVDTEGWEAVNAAYENPPISTEQLIHREKYPDEKPANVEIADSSSNGWHILDLEGGVDYVQFGEAGLYSMMWYPSFKATQQRGALYTVVIEYFDLFEYKTDSQQELDDIGPYDYAHPITDGFAGDKLYPYVNDDSQATNETGFVWKIEWDTRSDASEFTTAYKKVLEHYGAESVDGRPNTYRIPDSTEFGDAFYVVQQGSTVIIVNAPTVEDLGDVREGAGAAA